MSAACLDEFTAFFHGKERIFGRIDRYGDDHPVKKLTGAGHQIEVSVGKRVKRTGI